MRLTVDAIPGERLRWRLEGSGITPAGDRWADATAAQRARYWPILAAELLSAWRAQMLQGIGRRGRLRKVLPISRQMMRQEGLPSDGPPLLPRMEGSRAYRLARTTPYADLGRVTGFFGGGWGRILSYHHEGVAGRGIPIWSDDGSRLVGWMGLRGKVTGIVRDLMPTKATADEAVSAARRRWLVEVLVSPKPKPRPKPKPEPEPKPRPEPEPPASVPTAPAETAAAIEFVGEVSEAFRGRVERAYADLPERMRRLLAEAGYRVVVGRRLSEYRPDLASVRPRGWPEGRTWDDADCYHDRERLEAAVFELSRGGPSYRAAGALRHEIGHAIDAILGGSPGEEASRSRAFREAYDADVAAIPEADRDRLAYYLQRGDAGRSEAFAEMFGSIYGGGAGLRRDAEWFPRVVSLVRSLTE
jgi:hypothetical protein